jgi:hypothetical protein
MIYFCSLYMIDAQCIKDANSICQQMIRFFQLLTIPTNTDIAITQELLSLVTGLAQNLKSLIRFGLKSALHLVRIITKSVYFFNTSFRFCQTILNKYMFIHSFFLLSSFYLAVTNFLLNKGTRHWHSKRDTSVSGSTIGIGKETRMDCWKILVQRPAIHSNQRRPGTRMHSMSLANPGYSLLSMSTATYQVASRLFQMLYMLNSIG